jgi:hypothetical protein
MSVVAAAIQDDGLTLREVVQNLPHDGPALLVYVLVALFIAFILHGSRRAGPDRGERPQR